MSKPVVLLYAPIHEKALDFLSQRAEVRLADSLDEDDLIQAVADVDGIIIRAQGKGYHQSVGPPPLHQQIDRALS